jgi:hypothetical protein
MPPNRRSNVDVVNTVASISVSSLQPKFLPLTHPQEEEQRRQSIESSRHKFPGSSDEEIHAGHTEDSPWDWQSEPESRQCVIDRIRHEEKIRQLLSVTHLEESAKQTRPRTQDGIRSNNKKIVDDDYWFMPPEERDGRVVYSTQSELSFYWDWPSHTKQEEKDLTIQSILMDERCRQLVSMDHIEKNLTKQAAIMATAPLANPHLNPENDAYWDWNNPQKASDVSDQDNRTVSYWDWPNDVDAQEQEKTRIIQDVLQEERIRQSMSVEHLESKLVAHAQQHHSLVAPTGLGGASDSYWDW